MTEKAWIAAACSVIFFLLFAVLLKLSNISVATAVNVPNEFFLSFLSPSSGTYGALAAFVQPFLGLLVAFVFLSASLSFLAAAGYFSINARLALASGLACFAISVLLFMSLAGFFLGLAALVSFYYIVFLANTYGKELKRWVRFRVGSNSISKALLVFSTIIAVGIFFAVLSALPSYQSSFRSDLKTSVTSAVSINSVPPEMQSQISALIEQRVDDVLNSPLFVSYFNWLPAIAAIGAWLLLEFVGNLILANLGGVFTFFITAAMDRK